MTWNNIDELKTKQICDQCVAESYLKSKIQQDGKQLECSYCHKIAATYSIGRITELIDTAFDRHYALTENELTGEPVVDAIMNAADISGEAAQDVQQILEDKYWDKESSQMGIITKFSARSHYYEKGVDAYEWQEAWHSFERSLKTEARFFSRPALEYLSSIFSGIDTMRTQEGRSLVVMCDRRTKSETVGGPIV